MVATTMTRFDRMDRRITEWMAAHGVTLLRVALGVVFLWFGALEARARAEPGRDPRRPHHRGPDVRPGPRAVAVPFLALWEVAIGIGLLIGRWMRVTLALLFVQMLGTITPLFLFPAETWQVFPIAPTLEGQYIIKNIVLVSAAIVLGATVRGGELTPEPVHDRSSQP